MTRTFDPAPLDPALLGHLLDLARRAPSAGFAQGVHFVVLQGAPLRRFWELSGAGEWYADRQAGVLNAPAVVLALADPAAYTARYEEADKAGHGLEREAGWPVPYWLTDASMAVQNLLLLAEVHGMGALFFGIFRNGRDVLDELGVPPAVTAVGAVALGRRAAADRPSGSAATRPRRPAADVIHHNRW